MSRPRVFVAMPVYQSVQLETFLAVLNMTGHVAADFEFGISSTSLIAIARAHLLAMFMRTDREFLLWIDADIGFPPETITRLLAVERDIVAGPFALRRATSPPAVGALETGLEPGADGVAEIEWAGTGLLLMRRSVIEQMIAAYPELLQPLGPVGPAKEEFPLVPHLFHYLDPSTPEDISFCRRWRAIGGKIHALLDCETVHYGVDAHPMNAMKWLVRETVLRTAGLQTAWNPADANAASPAHS